MVPSLRCHPRRPVAVHQLAIPTSIALALLAALGVLASGPGAREPGGLAPAPAPTIGPTAPLARSAESENAGTSRPLVPDDLWKRYVEALEKTSWHRTLRGLERSELEPKVAAWSEALGVELRAEWNQFARELPDGPGEWSDVDLGDERAVLSRVEEEVRETSVIRHILCTTTDPKEEYPWRTAYRVPEARIAELGFPYAEAVRILHPLHRIPESPSGGISLPELLRMVCSSVGIDSAAGPHEEGRDLVTFALSGRTAAEHLELAAAATGRSFRVLEHGETQEIGRCRDEYVHTSDVHREIVRDAVLREGSETAAPEPTPAGVLERLLTRNAGALKSRRPVVVLLPASAAK